MGFLCVQVYVCVWVCVLPVDFCGFFFFFSLVLSLKFIYFLIRKREKKWWPWVDRDVRKTWGRETVIKKYFVKMFSIKIKHFKTKTNQACACVYMYLFLNRWNTDLNLLNLIIFFLKRQWICFSLSLRGMAQQLRIFVSLTEDPGSVSSTHMIVQNHPYVTPFPRDHTHSIRILMNVTHNMLTNWKIHYSPNIWLYW